MERGYGETSRVYIDEQAGVLVIQLQIMSSVFLGAVERWLEGCCSVTNIQAVPSMHCNIERGLRVRGSDSNS